MAIKIFNKLVRDKIPEIIASTGSTANIRILDNKEYSKYLREKLLEETTEFLTEENDNIEELADIYEVILAILDLNNVSFNSFEEVCKQKRDKRGSFKNKIFLLSVKE